MSITKKTIQNAIKYLAEEQHTSEAVVYENIRQCLAEAKQNPDPNVQAYWNSIPHAGAEPTVEEVLIYLAARIKANADQSNYRFAK